MQDKLIFVSPHGNDAWTGNLPDASQDGGDGPLLTIAAAAMKIRAWRTSAGALEAPVNVVLRGGLYHLKDTLVLNQDDSGTAECPVAYTAYPDEEPILSGGISVRGWQPVGSGIFAAALPHCKGGRHAFRSLFYQNRPMPRARWPKADPDCPISSGWAFVERDFIRPYQGWMCHMQERPHASLHTFGYGENDHFGAWKKPWLAEVSYYASIGGWRSLTHIDKVDAGERVVTLADDGVQWPMAPWYYMMPIQKGNRYYVENVLEELTEPGEWCLDSDDGLLYFMPPDGQPPADGDVIAPYVSTLIYLAGARHVTLSGLTFTHTQGGDNMLRSTAEGGGCMGKNFGSRYVGEAVRMQGCTLCRVEGSRFIHCGGHGVYLELDNDANTIAHNEIAHAGAGGVVLAGSNTFMPRRNQVTDNHIHHCARVNKGMAGVFLAMSGGNMVAHNHIAFMPHHGINLAEAPNGRNILEYNHIHHVCQENEDNGAINCWMEMPAANMERCGHIIRHNLIHDVYGISVKDGKVDSAPENGLPAHGIYLDNYASNCTVYGNIIARCTSSGVMLHGGKNNLVENNLIIGCGTGVNMGEGIGTMDYWKKMMGFQRDTFILRNVFVRVRHVLCFGPHHPEVVAFAEGNLFDNTPEIYHYNTYAGERLILRDDPDNPQPIRTFADWQALGYDVTSRIADPLVSEPEAGRFVMADDSPAYELGFQRINGYVMGVRGK